MTRYLVGISLLLFVALAMALWGIGRGWLGVRQDAGEVTTRPLPSTVIDERALRQHSARRAIADRAGAHVPHEEDRAQILFGDLHVHTTFSFDAFMLSLPLFQGEGIHPPADACDFARYCAALDFWSINDHAEGLTPHQWAETKRTVRQCNEVAGSSGEPDLVSFLGWEWTQIGTTPQDHYGHKNVLLRDTSEGKLPRRPISSRRDLFPPNAGAQGISVPLRLLLVAGAPGSEGRQPYLNAARFLQDRDDLRACPPGVPVRDLPEDCQESAATPRELFEKLDAWGHPYLVIPHGNTWGFYTPPGSSWNAQLAAHEDPARHEPLIEVFSGHGNSEEYRDWRAVEFDDEGQPRCPRPVPNYLPSCWRAGEIIRARCSAAGESDEECEGRAREARQNYVEAGTAAHVTVPAAEVEDWLDAGQCRDCYLPAFNYRPGGSSQYALALTNFDDPQRPKRFRFGFIASSDGHTARPGTGYKELDRREMTDAGLGGFGTVIPSSATPEPRSAALGSGIRPVPEFERFASFFGTGGLVAVHSTGRDRQSIWEALERRQVYGSSGDRILLWFDLLRESGGDANERTLPMGSRLLTAGNPSFRVRAAGAFRQLPGCPSHASSALSAERLHQLCRGECYHPSDERKLITRIEVVRIRPQASPGEDVAGLIEDPWKVLSCPPDPAGCSVRFSDPDFAAAGRDALYYVRAIQEPSPTINAARLRCTYDDAGRCIEVSPCHGGDKTAYQDDCLAQAEERAWSSPIFVSFER